jgi:hypothetical protein
MRSVDINKNKHQFENVISVDGNKVFGVTKMLELITPEFYERIGQKNLSIDLFTIEQLNALFREAAWLFDNMFRV